MDYIVIAFGVIILLAAILAAFMAGKRNGIHSRLTDDNWVSLRGLSQPSIDFVNATIERRHIWEEKRGPNKRLFRKVHID